MKFLPRPDGLSSGLSVKISSWSAAGVTECDRCPLEGLSWADCETEWDLLGFPERERPSRSLDLPLSGWFSDNSSSFLCLPERRFRKLRPRADIVEKHYVARQTDGNILPGITDPLYLGFPFQDFRFRIFVVCWIGGSMLQTSTIIPNFFVLVLIVKIDRQQSFTPRDAGCISFSFQKQKWNYDQIVNFQQWLSSDHNQQCVSVQSNRAAISRVDRDHVVARRQKKDNNTGEWYEPMVPEPTSWLWFRYFSVFAAHCLQSRQCRHETTFTIFC